MKTYLVSKLVAVLIAMLDAQAIKRLVDSVLDVAEDAVKNSQTKVDDAIVLPLISAIRTALEIPDFDDENEAVKKLKK